MTVLFGTGFELGANGVVTGDNSISSAEVHTGVYSLYLGYGGTMYAPISPAQNEIYVTMWVFGGFDYINLLLDSTTLVRLAYNVTSGCWDAYRGTSTLIASGTKPIPGADVWYCIQFRVTIDDSSGIVETWIDGVADIDFTGDTKPGSDTTINQLFAHQNVGGYVYIDDITIATTQLGDIRYDALQPDGDDTAEWAPSAGGDNYALVDEIPYSDADYLTSGSSPGGHTDKHTLEDWSSTGKSPQFCMCWVRAWKTAAGVRQIEHGIDSSGVEDTSGYYDMSTSGDFYSYPVESDPYTSGSFTPDSINSLKHVLRADSP